MRQVARHELLPKSKVILWIFFIKVGFGFGQKVTVREHSAIYEAAINRDSAACIAAIEQHVTLYHDGNRSTKPLPSKNRSAAGMRALGGIVI